MILPIVSALLAILIYGTCSFALYKVFLDRGNTYMDRLRKSRARGSSVPYRDFSDKLQAHQSRVINETITSHQYRTGYSYSVHQDIISNLKRDISTLLLRLRMNKQSGE